MSREEGMESGASEDAVSCNSEFSDENSRRDSDYSVEIELKAILDGSKNCRICHVSDSEGQVPAELGCFCRDDLAAAHELCARTWFTIRGNKICEICNSIARNVAIPNDIEACRELDGMGGDAIAASAPAQCCFCRHRLWNVLLTCLLLACGISWFFHFDISPK